MAPIPPLIESGSCVVIPGQMRSMQPSYLRLDEFEEAPAVYQRRLAMPADVTAEGYAHACGAGSRRRADRDRTGASASRLLSIAAAISDQRSKAGASFPCGRTGFHRESADESKPRRLTCRGVFADIASGHQVHRQALGRHGDGRASFTLGSSPSAQFRTERALFTLMSPLTAALIDVDCRLPTRPSHRRRARRTSHEPKLARVPAGAP